MAGRRRTSFSGVFVTTLLAVMLLPVGESIQERATAAELHRRLIRNRRNISWYKQHSDFWGWYKYFTDNGNQEAVQEMDRIYLAYLQNKNRAEGRRSYKAYLRHLGEIYKSCADSDDPNCVASSTSRPKPKPEPPKPAPVKTCDPTKDPYCLYAALVQGKSPYLPLVLPVLPAATPAPAPVKAPAPLYVRSAAPAKDPQSGYYYYAPSAVPFLTKEQKAELLRICSSDDVECLQYHLRAANGYAPSAGPLPSYAHLGCDPKKDPTCKPKLVQKAPSGLYLQYPNCDPLRDPLCAYAASLVAPRAPNPPVPAGPGSCNPLFEEGCNPLSATRFASPPEAYANEDKDEAAAIRAAPPPAEQNNDPYAMFRDAYANANANRYPFSQPNYEEPPREERHPLGPPGKTKEGYDCFIGYDRECFPVKPNEPRSGVHRRIPYPAEAYEPHLNPDGTRIGVMEPDNPHCDPEHDPDCRLRRYEPEQTHAEAQPAEEDHNQGAAESETEQDPYEAEPYQSGQEEPHMSYQPLSQGMPSLQDILRRYGDQYPEQGDHRAYADDYRKK
ncbi:actinodin1 [Pempheris klunzingeri]|uniref:actinodin1 n=1 Tax=Pempheris klunzingeri TaxID=3127111 RepID=UPI00397F4C06